MSESNEVIKLEEEEEEEDQDDDNSYKFSQPQEIVD